MQVKVVNSLSCTSEYVSVNVFNKVLFPTEGKPISPIRASPDLITSKPSPFAPPERIMDSTCSLRDLAILAFNKPRCPSVALFFWVLAISSSISAIFWAILIYSGNKIIFKN